LGGRCCATLAALLVIGCAGTPKPVAYKFVAATTAEEEGLRARLSRQGLCEVKRGVAERCGAPVPSSPGPVTVVLPDRKEEIAEIGADSTVFIPWDRIVASISDPCDIAADGNRVTFRQPDGAVFTQLRSLNSEALERRLKPLCEEKREELRTNQEAENERRRLAAEQEHAKERAIADEEIRSGRCRDDRYQKLQEFVGAARSHFEALGRSRGLPLFRLTTHETAVARPGGDGTDLSLKMTLGGEVHIIAVSYDAVKLQVRDGNGYAVEVGSPWIRLLQAYGFGLSGRVVQAKSGEQLTVRTDGAGCTLVMAFRNWR
jgi:hypothetical protein